MVEAVAVPGEEEYGAAHRPRLRQRPLPRLSQPDFWPFLFHLFF